MRRGCQPTHAPRTVCGEYDSNVPMEEASSLLFSSSRIVGLRLTALMRTNGAALGSLNTTTGRGVE